MKARLPVLMITVAVLVAVLAIVLIPVPQPRPDFSRVASSSAGAGESASAPGGALAGAHEGPVQAREITWQQLMPQDWDPARQITELRQDLSQLPDTSLRAAALLQRMRQVWDHAPPAAAMDGVTVRIAGYVVPLETSGTRHAEFLLVPYFGACIHTPPPPANQIIHVVAGPLATRLNTMDTVWVSGVLAAAHSESAMGSSSYRLEAVAVQPYAPR